MFYFHLLLFSILLYNTEARAYHEYDWPTPTGTMDGTTTSNKTVSTASTNGTESESVTLPKTEAIKPENDNWYNETATDDKPYYDDDEYAYLTVENGILTAHFPEKSKEKKQKSSNVDVLSNKTGEKPTNTINKFWNWTTDGSVIDYKENKTLTDLHNTTVNDKTYTTPNYWYNWTNSYGPRETTTLEPTETTANPIKISINSAINTNEGRIYGTVADFLKKLAGTILPSAGNIAPNSSIANLAVANGNGNIFFYVSN